MDNLDTDWFNNNSPQNQDNPVSRQDRLVNNMSLEELRRWRIDTARQASEQGKFASQHNRYLKDTIRDIKGGERLTSQQLQSLVASAKSLAGISASELLEFTLGNTKRNESLMQVLDASVLDAYLANVKKAAKKFAGGITPQDVINNSRPVDIQRANKQIYMAMVYKRQGNTLFFLTNSGPESKVANHKVTVQLLDYPGLLLRTKPPSLTEVRNSILHGKIRFDCDCGRHQFWYRYIATVGKYNYGIDENRYPSTRNPNLTGVACKHVLRVMKHLTSGMMLSQVRDYAKADIAMAENQVKSHRRTSQQVKREAAKQTQALNNWNGRLHWAKVIKQAVKQAEQKVRTEQKRQAKARPHEPTKAELSSYKYAQSQLQQKGIPDRYKQLYQADIQDFEKKWGER